jgi:hypothetical protein
VDLADIIGRDEIVTELWRDVERGNIRINEMRRFGKTSVLRLMESRTPAGWVCVRTSVQAARSSSDLIAFTLKDLLLHAGIKQKLKQALTSFGQLVDHVDVKAGSATFQLRPEFQASPAITFPAVLHSVNEALVHGNQRLLIMWDEFPDAIGAIAKKEGADAARDLLALFRANRESSDSDRIRWILTGSVGFHHVLKAVGGHGALTNDVAVKALGPLSPEWSRWFAESLLLGVGRRAAPIEAAAIAAVSGGIPFVCALMIRHLRDDRMTTWQTLPRNTDQARDLLIDAATDPSLSDDWTPLLSRVDDYYGDESELVETILDTVARTAMTETEIEATRGMQAFHTQERDVHRLFDLLLQDHYLTYDWRTGLYSWKYEPLRTIWQAMRRKA